jgi:BirA family biotin operon repressor/biotin-[acetyl-CoA-carboxylase] ligase
MYAFHTIGSTNDFARRLGRNKEPEGSVVVAEHQTKGRGRHGRTWESPPGVGLWLSLLLRPRIETAELGVLPLFAGLCVAEAVAGTVGLSAELKWPNDVLLGTKKFCGILSESEFRHERLDFVVIGIGINVNQDEENLPPELRQQATSLRLECGGPVDRIELLTELLQVLDRNYLRAKREGFGVFLEPWKSRCPYVGKMVDVVVGENVYHGVFADIAPDGALLLQMDEGIRPFSAGEISLRVH